jgi:hypothetical protein
MMNSAFKIASRAALRFGLFRMGFHIVRTTDTAKVAALIEKLHPINCGIDLVRFGPKGDGGYLIPDDLEGIDYLFSPGVKDIAEFESQLADRGIKSFLADYSIDRPPIDRPEFVFEKQFLGASDRDPFFTMASWKQKYLDGYSGDLLLQMDIEGYEYEVILNTPESLIDQFRIMVIEFHELDRLFDVFTFKLLSTCFEKLLKTHYVVHIHPNNYAEVVKRDGIEIPRVMEFTFLNRKHGWNLAPQRSFPHRLDADCTAGKATVVLPSCWYS